MVPNPRVVKALNSMKALEISAEEVQPVLAELLRVYDRNWELIEEDNYRTLIDAYFDYKEDKRTGGKEKTNSYAGDGQRQKLPLIDVDDQDLSTRGNSNQKLSAEDKRMRLGTFKQEMSEPSRTLKEPRNSSQASQTRLSVAEKMWNSPCKVAEDRKTYPNKASSARHCDDSEQELLKPITKKPKLPVRPISTNCNGLSEASNEYRWVKSLSTPIQSKQSKDASSSCNNNAETRKGNIMIASSPQGEVKLSLNCEAALGQGNFSTPNLDAVMKFMEEKYLKYCRNVGPQIPMMKLLDGLCKSFLKLGLRNGSNSKEANSDNTASLPQQGVAQGKKNSCRFISDITKGLEMVKISLIDEIGSDDLPKYNYIPQNIIYESANVNISLARISDEGCCSDCSGNCLASSSLPCACAQETGGEFAYTPQGLLKEEFLAACVSMKNEPKDHHFVYCQECPVEKSKNEYMPERCKGHMLRKFIKECWRKCGCDIRCGNRVVQRGIRCKLQVFMTREGKGWGLRPLEDLPKGTFVCEYAGEILTNTELYERIMGNSGNDRHTYPVTLDADWGSEGVLKDEEALCLDATYNGNVARFINHRCFDANLIDIPVEVETPDHHYYHLAFFTNRNVRAYEELTWDYGIDFDDHEHPIKAFECCCGSAFCCSKKGKGKKKVEK